MNSSRFWTRFYVFQMILKHIGSVLSGVREIIHPWIQSWILAASVEMERGGSKDTRGKNSTRKPPHNQRLFKCGFGPVWIRMHQSETLNQSLCMQSSDDLPFLRFWWPIALKHRNWFGDLPKHHQTGQKCYLMQSSLHGDAWIAQLQLKNGIS